MNNLNVTNIHEFHLIYSLSFLCVTAFCMMMLDLRMSEWEIVNIDILLSNRHGSNLESGNSLQRVFILPFLNNSLFLEFPPLLKSQCM